MVNALECCEGLFTRTRNRQGQVQNSIIDFFVVCKRVLPHVTQMVVDDKRQFTMTNFKGAKHGKKAVDSEHVMLLIIISLNISPQKPQRLHLFDFKNLNGQKLFKKLTTDTTQFTGCFEGVLPLLEKCETWQKTLEAYCVQSYPIIRIRNKNMKSSSADKLIVKRN